VERRTTSHLTRTRLARAWACASVAVGAAIFAIAPASAASAHDYLVASTPKADSTQSTALTKVVLTFSDRVLDLSGDGSSNVAQVTDSAGRHFESGCPAIADTAVTVPVALGASGPYTVTWQVVSADGHTVSSSLRFTYVRPAGAVVAAGAGSRPTCGDQAAGGGSGSAAGSAGSSGSSGSSGGTTSGSGSNSSADSGLGIALGVGGGIIGLAVIAVVIVLVRNRAVPPEG
jgi:methionine-rich copper-binding protein CopC